jgi:oligopeptide/dipeptide ABC transporter ATP-binding protein
VTGSRSRNVLDVAGLTVAYESDGRSTVVVSDVAFSIAEHEILGLAGESGCGKSTVAYSLLGERRRGSRILSGTIDLDGIDILSLSSQTLETIRGVKVTIVPQNPALSLTPTMVCGKQLKEVMTYHGIASGRTARDRAIALLHEVGLADPEAAYMRYPHQLSGGQQQRVIIAMAVACRPRLIVLDEPTTGLDVTTQARILKLLAELRDRFGTAMLYVSHDLAALAQISDRIGVMYAGRLVEVGPIEEVFWWPRHPYTAALVASIPQIDRAPASAPPLRGGLRRDALPPGCPFAPRCTHALAVCHENRQMFEPISPRHVVACQRWRELNLSTYAPVMADPRAGHPEMAQENLDGRVKPCHEGGEDSSRGRP